MIRWTNSAEFRKNSNIYIFAVIAAILAVLDHRRNWLPDCLTLPLAAAGLLINLHDTLASSTVH